MRALCTGSFDPITIGHFDYIKRLSALFDSVVVAVNTNSEKRYMFSEEDRYSFAKAAFCRFENVEVVKSNGWAADLAAQYGADVIVKGVRGSIDLEYEDTISTVNREVSGVETLYIPASPALSHINSTAVREMIKHGKDYKPFIPEGVVIEYGKDV